MELAVLLDRMGAHPVGEKSRGQLPDLLGVRAVLGIGHHHVGRQAVGEGAHFARGAAGRGLAGERERRVAGLGDLPGQQVQVVDHVIGPDPADMLVEAHGPERHHLAVRIGVEFGQLLEQRRLHSRNLCRFFERVFGNEGGEGLEIGRRHRTRVRRALGGQLKLVLGAQPVADVGGPQREVGVPVDEVPVDPAGGDDVVGDVVQDREVGARPEDDGRIGQIHAAVGEGRQDRHAHMLVAQPPVGQPAPEDRVHLGHVRAPEHEGIGGLEIIVAAHRLVHAKGAHEGGGGRRHAVARVGVEIVRSEARPHELGGRVPFPDGPLPRAEHADGLRALLLQHALGLGCHDIEGLVPRDGRELALLVVDPVLHAQKRRGQPVLAIHDLGQEIALHAVEAAIHFGLGVTVGRNHLPVARAHHDAAAGPAEAAGRLRPADPQGLRPARDRLGQC